VNKFNQNTNNLVWHHATVTRQRREAQNGHYVAIIWLAGLFGNGKVAPKTGAC
jgi:adenylylsulfate kinase